MISSLLDVKQDVITIMKKKIFTLLFAIVASTTISHAAIVNGTCGQNLQWSFDASDSTLVVTGRGPMDNYTVNSPAPWKDYFSVIKNIQLPEGLTRIGNRAFSSCNAVRELVIPDSVIAIGEFALNTMRSLKKITLGAQLQTIEYSAVTALSVDTLISRATFDTWCRSSFDMGGVIRTNEALIIDGQLVTGDFHLPSTVHRINDDVFYYCPGLTGMHFPASVDTIGRVFGTDYKDHIYTYEGTIEQWCRMVHTKALRFMAYTLRIGEDDLTNLVLPEGLTGISAHAFEAVSNIKHVTLPSTMTSVPSFAFRACGNITDVTGGANIRYFGEDCFGECHKIRAFNIPRETRYIGDRAFWVVDSLRGTIRLDSLEYLGENAFSSTGIDSVILPDHLNTIGGAFVDCPNLAYVHLPASLREIPDNCFTHDTALHELVIPDSVERIGYSALYNTGIRELTLPASLQYLERAVFLYMNALERMTVLSATPPTCESSDYTFGFPESCMVEVACDAIGAYRQAAGWSSLTNYVTNPYIGTSAFSSNNISWGTVAIEQDCADITLTATPKAHYHFVRWSNGETANPYSFTQTGDTVIQAIFEIDRFRVAFLNCDSSVIYEDSVVYNTMPVYVGGTPVHPVSPDDFLFYGWNPSSFNRVTSDVTYVAQYTDLRVQYGGLCFHALEPSSFYCLKNSYSAQVGTVQVSRDGQHWEGMSMYFPRTIAKGDSLFIRSQNNDAFKAHFVMDGAIMATGSVMSLLDTTLTRTDVPDEAFMSTFGSCTALYTAPELPATSVGRFGYLSMFYGCKNLRAAPSLPATTLGEDCYYMMFAGCDSLRYMDVAFTRWTNSQGQEFTERWLEGVAQRGVFAALAALPVVADSSHIPVGWTTMSDTTTYAISAKADNGRVLGTGRFRSGYPLVLAAVPDLGHSFLCWHTGAENNPLYATVTGDAVYYAFCPSDTLPLSDTTNVALLDNGALISWPMVDSATLYELITYEEEEEVLRLLLDVYGKVVGTETAPQTSYAPLRKAGMTMAYKNAEVAAPLVLHYYWDDLKLDTQYGYTVNAYKDEQLLKTMSGQFRLSEDIETGFIDGDTSAKTDTYKILHNGLLLILRGDRTYTVTGQEVK